MHGGLSTGPRTPTGLARSKQASWKHGRFSVEARQELAHFRELLQECKELESLIDRARTDWLKFLQSAQLSESISPCKRSCLFHQVRKVLETAVG